MAKDKPRRFSSKINNSLAQEWAARPFRKAATEHCKERITGHGQHQPVGLSMTSRDVISLLIFDGVPFYFMCVIHISYTCHQFCTRRGRKFSKVRHLEVSSVAVIGSDWRIAERKVVRAALFEMVTIVAMVTWSVTSPTTAGCHVVQLQVQFAAQWCCRCGVVYLAVYVQLHL